MLFLFGLALFVSAALLFLVQPMMAKMVLPLLGGTPAVWNTCVVFFQAALLAGYTYSHASTAWIGRRTQIALHLALILLPLVALPIALPQGVRPPHDGNPIGWLLLILAVSVGLPFFVVATSGPMLQKWFSHTSHHAARDPYFLYSASNLGSVAGLLGYLILVEPRFTLVQQGRIWSGGYVLLIVLTGLCALCSWISAGRNPSRSSQPSLPDGELSPGVWRQIRWVALAFVPSSLMLGVSTFLTTDIAAIPLLWVLPLALYLFTFILAFARTPLLPHRLFVHVLPILVLLHLILAGGLATLPGWWPIPLHLITFFAAAMVCHRQLAIDRPSAPHLTHFYLLISIGGVLGGAFNGLIAPVAFNSVAEYPIALVLACLLLPRRRSGATRFNSLDLLGPLALAMLTGGLLWFVRSAFDGAILYATAAMGAAALLCYAFVERPIRFALGVAALLTVVAFLGAGGGTVLQGRSFFGIYRVTRDTERQLVQLVHGTTVHGMQSMDPSRSREPLTYYHRTGPIGQVFETFGNPSARRNVAVVGLGTGSLAAYAGPEQRFTFYEIDPAIEHIASDTRYFTFLRDARQRGADVRVVLGDARLTLADAQEKAYDLIVLDAFSSDAIPMHLLTREALHLYMQKLAERGLLAFHISNRYLDLQEVLGALATNLDLICLYRSDSSITADESRLGKTASKWVILARRAAFLSAVANDSRWQSPSLARHNGVWTDDFSNVLEVLTFWKSTGR